MRQHCALSPRPSWDSVHQLCQLLLDQVIPTPLLPYTAVSIHWSMQQLVDIFCLVSAHHEVMEMTV